MKGAYSITITTMYNHPVSRGVDEMIDALNEEELRKVLLELKEVTKQISEAIVEKAKNTEKLDVDQTRVITNWIKKENLKKAIESHMFFVGSTYEEAEIYVNTVKQRLNE